MNTAYGTITLIGSGEFGESMGRTYRSILSRAPTAPNAIFLDTPAGFELNTDSISAKAIEYFSKRLNLELQIASYKNHSRATALELEAALRVLRHADFILAGPGSPSYAIHNWQRTEVWNTVINRFTSGAHLVFASAAAIATGALSVPVYEIYKAGQDVHWLPGLDLFSLLDLRLAIIPHWNNAEGGTYDTRFCFMGEERFRELAGQLPSDTVVLGIDEHTACIIDIQAQQCQVMGAGTVTIRCNSNQWSYATGESFPLAQLRQTRPAFQVESLSANQSESSATHSDEATYLMQVARALDETKEPEVKRELLDRAHDTMHELAAGWIDGSHTDTQQDIAPYVELLIELRHHLRDLKQYALADEIRARLESLDVILQDNPTGTTWHKG